LENLGGGARRSPVNTISSDGFAPTRRCEFRASMQERPTAATHAEDVRRVEVVYCCDEYYARHVAVSVRSVVDTLDPGWTARVWVVCSGLDATARGVIADAGRGGAATFEFVEADAREFAWAPVGLHVSAATYYRLSLPWLLPPEVHRLVYLDVDVIVERSLARLFVESCEGCVLAAVENPGIAHKHELGLPPDVRYFNAGVLLVDLDAWRERRVSERTLEFVRTHPLPLRLWDQDALNAVVHGAWKPLDWRWNQQAKLFRIARPPEFTRAEWRRVLEEPYVVHFSTGLKPWKYACFHPLRGRWFHYLDRTAHRGWRPRPEKPWYPIRRFVNDLLPVPWRV
jgi:lipopolysaccharide biosynthesis glycosyltransferase